MNINEPFKYDPFNVFQSGQIKQRLTKERMRHTRYSFTFYRIYENRSLELKHGDEIYYYLKTKLLDNRLFTKTYHYIRVINDTDLNKIVIEQEEIHLFRIREFLLKK